MTSSVSPRVLVPGGVALLIGVALSFFMMTRAQAAPSEPTVEQGISGNVVRTRPAPRTKANPVVPKAVTPKAVPPVVKAAPVLTPGLPSSVARALAQKRIVVVALYTPRSGLDAMAVKEARAGAALAGSAFVAFDVLNERQARPLTTLLGVLEAPAVVVFRRPGDVFIRIDGFADQETVAQAAKNAAR